MAFQFQDQLLSKNGLAVIEISRVFLSYELGQKLPTVTELSTSLDIPRGTVQNALKTLQANDAVRFESRGHLGSYLTKKNTGILLQFAGITSLVGAMPLPYSRKYEGMATGLISAMENSYDIPITLSYMRGARNRIAMVLEGRYDFGILSKYAADEFIEKNPSISIIKEFGPKSYCSSHVVIFHDPKAAEIKDGMKVGIDSDSIDQESMTKQVCRGKKVTFIPVEYNSLLERVMQGDLDATVWNEDEIMDRSMKINCRRAFEENEDDTNAVIIVSKKEPEIGVILSKIIKPNEVLKIQKLVMDGKISPSY